MDNEKNENGVEAHDFEQAISKAGFGWYNGILLVVCGISLMSVIMETLSMSFILPAAKCDLQLTLADKGTLSSVGFFGVVLSSLLWGFIGDTMGRKNVVIITSYISFLAGIASSLAPQVWMMIFLRFINCFFIGGPSAVVIAYLGEFQGSKHRARVIPFSATFVAIASIIMPALAWLILPMEWSFNLSFLDINYRPWRLLIILYGLPTFISATWLLFLPESPKYLWAMGKNEEALVILRRIFVINTGKKEEEYEVKNLSIYNENPIKKEPNNKPLNIKKLNPMSAFLQLLRQQIVPIFLPPLLIRTFMTSLLQFGVFAGSGVLLWMPEVLNRVSFYVNENNATYVSVCQAIDYNNKLNNNLTAEKETKILQNEIEICVDSINTNVFIISIIIGVAFSVTYLIIGFLISYTGKSKLLAGLLVVTGTAGVATHFMKTYLLISILFGLFVVGGAGVTILNTAVVDLFPTQYRSIAMAVSLMIGRMGAMTASHTFGYILEYYCEGVFYIFGGGYLVLAVVSLFLPNS